jgi:hypothetical protein
MSERIGLLLRLRGCDGDLCIRIETLDGRRLSVDESSLTAVVWREEPDVLRFRLEHGSTHQLAYLQGTELLDSLASALHLIVAPNTR